MTDIAKCSGEGCSVRETCWRYTAPSGLRQTWFTSPPGQDEGCPYYYRTTEKTRIPACEEGPEE